MSKWITIYPYYELAQLDPEPAVYVLYEIGKGVVYVGETSNLRARIHQHGFVLARYSNSYQSRQFGWIGDIRLKVKYSARFGEESMRERRLIRRLRPPFNFRGLKKSKAEAMPLKQA